MTTPPPANLCVMLSGSGRTLANLLQQIDAGELNANVALVIASRDCKGADIARSRSIPTHLILGSVPAGQLADLLAQHNIDLLVLAGYLKKVPILPGFEQRTVNIHPALLPDFGGPGMFGTRVHQAVIDAKHTTSGCTVHLCNDRYDEGRVLLQLSCPVHPDDTADLLAARVFELECQAYPKALAQLITELHTTPARTTDQ